MNRIHHFTRGLSASWFATLATVLYGLALVPLALQFLSLQEFGLFMLLIQLAGYFALIELGVTGAASRLLIDHKDKFHTSSYGSLILTGCVVFAFQGVVILTVGLLAAPLIIAAVAVPSDLVGPAVYLLRWLCACFAFTTVFKMLGAILYAHKRLDLISYFSALNLFLGLVCMALILGSGGGLAGLAVVFVLQALVHVVCQAVACFRLRLKLLPRRGKWGQPTGAQFLEMFLFAKDIFLINISSQLLDASQLIIVTRTMGLSAAAMWSVGTKIFSLLYQLLTKIEGTAIVFFAEMMVRGEHERLKIRFRQIYQLSAGFAVASIAVAVAINAPFVSLWAEPTLAWKLPLSGLMGLAVFLNVVTRCHVDLILHTKTVSGLRYLYLLEAVAFVSLAFVLAPIMGFYGIVSASVLCIFLVRFWYVAWRTASYFRIPVQTIGWLWLKRPLLASLLLIPFIASSPWMGAYFSSSLLQLVATGLWTGIPAVMVLAFVALPVDSSVEIRRTLYQQAQAIICAVRAMF